MPRRIIYIKNPSSGSHFRSLGDKGSKPGSSKPSNSGGGVTNNTVNSILAIINAAQFQSPLFPNNPNQPSPYDKYTPQPITGFVAGLTDAFGNSLYAPTEQFGNSNLFGNTNVVSPHYAPDIPSPDGATYADFGAPFKAIYKYPPLGTPGTLKFFLFGRPEGVNNFGSTGFSVFYPGDFPTAYQTPLNIGHTSEPIEPGSQDLVGAIVKIVKKVKKVKKKG